MVQGYTGQGRVGTREKDKGVLSPGREEPQESGIRSAEDLQSFPAVGPKMPGPRIESSLLSALWKL